jgi:YD repeat-containing protein
MNKYFFIALLLAASIFQNAFSQSPADRERQYKLYKTNKVKTETIQYNDGTKTVNSYDTDGRQTEETSYFDGKEANTTKFKYDSKGLMTEETYFGYESGDSYTTKYSYDAAGNMIKAVSTGSMEDIEEFTNDAQGNPVKISYYSPSDTKKPMDIMEYVNTYENGMLASIESTCKKGDETTFGSKFTYSGESMTLNQDYTKDCKTGKITNGNKKTMEYFDNGLTKSSKDIADYLDAPRTAAYTYEYYK